MYFLIIIENEKLYYLYKKVFVQSRKSFYQEIIISAKLFFISRQNILIVNC